MQKTLYILRHAKAENGKGGQDDHERALNDRGLKAARLMGGYMAGRGIMPARVLCSTAVRCRQTLDEVQQVYAQKLPVAYEKKLYLASGNEILNLLAAVSEDVPSLLIVGHNPGFHNLALKLAKDGDASMLETLSIKFPTAALATIAFNGPWHHIARARGTLIDFMTPKMLSGDGDD